MRRLPSWIIVGAVGIVVALAAADAIRPHGETQRSEPAQRPPDLTGLLVVAGPDCSMAALRLPGLTEQSPPRQPDCRGLIWSEDGSLAARCTTTNGTEILDANLEFLSRIQGCAPAWRPDGALSVIRNGDLVMWRRRGRRVVYVSRAQLADELAGQIEDGREYSLVDVAWSATISFAGVVAGPAPWQRAIIVYTANAVELVVPELGRRISALEVSPTGNYMAFATNQLGREFVLLNRAGAEVPIPRIANVHALAWSPDERWVALATRTATFIARTGTRDVVLRIPTGGDSLMWLPA
jgi:hypothetical protein